MYRTSKDGTSYGCDEWRWDFFAKKINKYGYKTFCEIGTAAGQNALFIMQRVNDSDFHLTTIDPYAVYDDFSADPKNVESEVKWHEKKAHENLDPYIHHGHCKMIKAFSKDAVNEFEDESFDVVFVDGNHKYEYVYEDMNLWYPKVKKGGMFSGHDYDVPQFMIDENPDLEFVKDAVDRWFTENNLTLSTEDNDNWVWWMIKE